MSDRWHCAGCGHHHGHENCAAIAHDDDGARRCGCTDHKLTGGKP